MTPLPKIAAPKEIQAQVSAPVVKTTAPPKGTRTLLAGLVFLVLLPILFAAGTLGSLYLQGQFPPKPAPKAAAAAPTPASNPNGAPNDATPTPAPQDQGQLPTPTSFTKVSSVDTNLSLQYPADWIAEAPSKSTSVTLVTIHPPQNQAIPFFVEIRHFTNNASSQFPSENTVNQGIMASIGNQFRETNVQNVTPANAQPTIGGVPWTAAEETFDGVDSADNPITVHIITVSVQRNKSYYNLTFLMDNSVASEATKKYVQPMLDSVQFLS